MRRWLPLVLCAVWLVGCGSSAAPAPNSPAPSTRPAAPATTAPATGGVTRISFLLDGPVTGYYAPFFAAIAQGDYRAAGLDVTILPGKGSVNTAEQVGHGNYPIGFADVTAEAAAVSQGIGLKAVAIYFLKSPLALVYSQQHPIATPADLAGKTVALSPGSAGAKLFPAFLKLNGVDPSKVKTVGTASIPAMDAALQQGKVDASLIVGMYAVPILDSEGFHAGQMLLADHGLPLLSNGIVVNDGYLQAHPSIVQAFVRATSQGWAYAAQHPAAAVADETKLAQAEGTKLPPGAQQMLQLALPLLHSAQTKGHPLGWMPPAAWTQTLDLLHRYEGLQPVLAPAAYYTNQFVAS